MEQILIVDPDHNHAIGLKEALEAPDCCVSVHHDHRTAMKAVIPQGISTVVFVSSSPSWWRNDLKALCESVATTPARDRCRLFTAMAVDWTCRPPLRRSVEREGAP